MSDAVIEIKNLCVDYRSAGGRGRVRALDGLSLTVKQGQVFGFVGPNGAGKTTTMHVLLGFVAATAGEARMLGQDVRHSIARQRIGFLPEHPDTYRFMTGRELLHMTGRLFLMGGRKLRERIDELADQVGLTCVMDRRSATYSRGMLQRLGLAQALIHDPELLILDEPTSGFDPIGKVGIRKIIASLRSRGKTVFFSSHELSEVELVCNQIGVIASGRIVAEGSVRDLVGEGETLEGYFLRVLS